MASKAQKNASFNIVVVGQSGRLQYEAALFAASLREKSSKFSGRLFVAEPQPGPLWSKDPRISNPDVTQLLKQLGAEMLPFENRFFGEAYAYGNKIELLREMPAGEPFVFFDTDTLITGEITDVPFDFDRPSASLKVEGSWPEPPLYGPQYTGIWKSLYDKFGIEFESSLDLTQPDEYWRRYLYFNAGFFYYRCPHEFGVRFEKYAVEIRSDPPEELACQSLSPWLDQVALPLVIHELGGGRDALPSGYLDGSVSTHYRLMPLMYARESDLAIETLEEVTAPNKVKKVLKQYDPFKRMIYQGRGHKARALFDRENLPRREHVIRNTLKRNGYWLR
ncbi:hypothetical protein BXY66_2118 [Shimia isoporae]|uniref:Uncharacterized protein n=1 Tax=Shimia isoporae TaxID=647720 RepID=A0A4V2Q467_9RHOB|nr:hypothetical protein [Shimia isoporae]TCL10050.1 hypothetical protein BXY66_2118 [Shimia isoporae]